ncbi:MAG: polymerase subunit sigma-24 [Phycisphaerales bacterium]|nr:polymerase subunit sigma-24 [Phycisphaerales bacterium]
MNTLTITFSDTLRASEIDSKEREHLLVARLRAGDERAYETLVRDYGGRMRAVARRYFACGQDADDAVQEAFIRVFKAIDSFEANARLASWLHRIVINSCLMKLRARDRRAAVLLHASALQANGEAGNAHPHQERNDACANAVLAESQSHIRGCIESLPQPYRQVLILRDIEEYDTQETAKLLNTTPSNIKTRLHRARHVLRGMLEPVFMAQDCPPVA